MEPSLKQRLLGASVLIALAVIFVPMFLGPSATREGSEMQTSDLAIPAAPEAEFETRVLSTAPAAGQLASVDTATAPPAEVATPLPEPAAPTVAPPPAEAPAATPAAPPAAAAPAPSAPGRAAEGRHLVHLGVYGATRNASDLVASLKQAGFPAFAEATTWQGKPAQRVQVGPYADRAAAEAARLRIRQLRPDVPSSVAASAGDAPGDAPAEALAPDRAGAWAVQVAALESEADANRLRERLKAAGFASFADRVAANGKTLWRVRVGPEVDRAAAERQRTAVRDKLKLDGVIVTQP